MFFYNRETSKGGSHADSFPYGCLDKYGVANVNGVVILSDAWTLTVGVTFTNGVAATDGADYYKTVNSYALAVLGKMKAAAHFSLPHRHGYHV